MNYLNDNHKEFFQKLLELCEEHGVVHYSGAAGEPRVEFEDGGIYVEVQIWNGKASCGYAGEASNPSRQ